MPPLSKCTRRIAWATRTAVWPCDQKTPLVLRTRRRRASPRRSGGTLAVCLRVPLPWIAPVRAAATFRVSGMPHGQPQVADAACAAFFYGGNSSPELGDRPAGLPRARPTHSARHFHLRGVSPGTLCSSQQAAGVQARADGRPSPPGWDAGGKLAWIRLSRPTAGLHCAGVGLPTPRMDWACLVSLGWAGWVSSCLDPPDLPGRFLLVGIPTYGETVGRSRVMPAETRLRYVPLGAVKHPD